MNTNKKEVGCTPDDNNDRRLPGSVQPEAKRGDSAYGPGKYNMAKPTSLDAADTGGVVGMPTMDSGMGQEGHMMPHQNANVSVSGPKGVVETTYNHENLSKKYKYPQVHQDVPPLGNPSTTYSDHS